MTKIKSQDKYPKLDAIHKSKNAAELLDDETLAIIGAQVVRGYEIDEDSRAEWKATVDKAMDIAKQIMEPKSFPWPGAANIKMPIITRACIDYASRTLPEIIPNERLVKGVVVGKDPDGSKQRRCDRVATYMSYQLLNESPDWEAGTDSLLQTLPVLGTVFKKTYYCDADKRCISEMCVPDKIVVNYSSSSLETARRVTHILTMYTNDILERQRRGLYLDDMTIEEFRPAEGSSEEDKDFPIDILEQHCYLDLDGDDYKEPYVVTVHKDTGKVLKIANRFKKIDKIEGKVAHIEPYQYFTDFHFIKSPDGGFYSMGFGSLLLPINTAINTLINMLLDSGTISNTQGGFVTRGLRIKNGEFRFKQGEWKILDAASGTNLSENIFPLPVREPSQTLYQLLGLMLNEAKDLSSTTDVLLGKQPAQNVASNTISQLVDQGTKVFTAINKRVYRSLKKEYKKLYELNYYYLKQRDYITVLDDEEADVKIDFELDTCDVHPVADPTLSSDQQRLARAGVVQQLQTVDRRAADEMVLDAMQLEASVKEKLIPAPDPQAPPPPEMMKIMAEIEQIKASVANMAQLAAIETAKVHLSQQKADQDREESDSRIQESIARVWKMQQDALHNKTKDTITATKMQHEGEIKQVKMANSIHKDQHTGAIQEIKAAQEGNKIKQKDTSLAIDAMLKKQELDLKAYEIASNEKIAHFSNEGPSNEEA